MKNNWKEEFDKEFQTTKYLQLDMNVYHVKTHRIQSHRQDIKDFIESLLAEQKKAYGGCDKCFGKGYATNIDFMSGRGIHYQAPYYLPCDCNRGEQIREMMSEQKKEFLMSENSEWHKDELRKEIKKELLDLVAKEIEKKYDIDYNVQDEPFRSNNLYNEALDNVSIIINKLRV